jgi:predicted Zn-dependent protease
MARHILILNLIFWSGILAAQSPTSLPDMGGSSTRVLPIEQEMTFARDFERYMRANQLLIEDPLIRDYFEDMGYRLVAQSDRQGGSFHFFILRENSINAFASVAGVIGLHSGLILLAEDENEVAGVVAHEIAHVTQNHLARGLENQQQVSLPAMIATLGLAIAASAAGNPDAGQALILGGLGLSQQMMINHTRQAEMEADRIGISLLGRAGFDPQGMTRFFERMNVRGRAMGQGPPEYLRTHPLSINRVAEARSRAQDVVNERARMAPSEEFHFVQSRLRVLMTNRMDHTIRWFQARLDNGSRPPLAMHYGLALALSKESRMDEAMAHLEVLLAQAPDRQIVKLLQAEILLSDGQFERSLAILETLHLQFPGSRKVTSQYAETLMHGDSPAHAAQASAILRPYLRRHPTDLRMTQLLAQAADRSGDVIRAAEAVADSYYLRGGVREAIEQLERVRERDDLNYYERARIGARLRELRSEQLRMVSQP